MSVLKQPDHTSPSASGAVSWRSPLAMALYLPGFAAALLCGWSLASHFQPGKSATTFKTALAGGGLPLLHAQEEADLVRRAEAAAQNQDLASLTQAVSTLRTQLKQVQSQIEDSQKHLKDTEASIASAEARKQSYVAEKKRLEQVLEAFAKANTERQTAAKLTMHSALSFGTGMLSADDLTKWKTEWDTVTADAFVKIKSARTSVLDLQKLKTKWETDKDSLTAAQKAEFQGQLVTQQSTTESSLKAALEAAASAEKVLSAKIKEQAGQLDQALQNAAK